MRMYFIFIIIISIFFIPAQHVKSLELTEYCVVKGYTYYMLESESGISYKPLPGVKITAYREYPILEEPVISGLMGTFELKVPKGKPFWVLLYGEGRVPELQQLTAKGDTESTFHITLLTVKQYKEMRVVDQVN